MHGLRALYIGQDLYKNLVTYSTTVDIWTSARPACFKWFMMHWKKVQCCFMDNWKSANARKTPPHFDVSFLLSFSLPNRRISCWDMLSPCPYFLIGVLSVRGRKVTASLVKLKTGFIQFLVHFSPGLHNDFTLCLVLCKKFWRVYRQKHNRKLIFISTLWITGFFSIANQHARNSYDVTSSFFLRKCRAFSTGRFGQRERRKKEMDRVLYLSAARTQRKSRPASAFVRQLVFW